MFPKNPSSDNLLSPGLDKSWQKRSEEHQKQYKQFLQRADKNKVLKQLPHLHDDAFAKIDCLK